MAATSAGSAADVSARGKARQRAIQLLFEADLRDADPVATLADRVALGPAPVNPYTTTLIEGVTAHRERIDTILSDYAEGWTLPRMPGVDKAVLRVGIYEILWSSDVPPAVAIDEAVELAKTMSTDESPRFVNGVLARVLRDQSLLSA
jgi:N utilization substance protein B